MLLNSGTFTWTGLVYTFAVSVVFFLVGLVIFNKTEKSFVDTV
jgi:lipopolysaccharide transport system permease protein